MNAPEVTPTPHEPQEGASLEMGQDGVDAGSLFKKEKVEPTDKGFTPTKLGMKPYLKQAFIIIVMGAVLLVVIAVYFFRAEIDDRAERRQTNQVLHS